MARLACDSRLLGYGLVVAALALPVSSRPAEARAATVGQAGARGLAAAWGNGSSGQLGDNATTASALPVAVSGLSGGVTAIAAGHDHTLALKPDGSVVAWGGNAAGQLGDNTTTSSTVPVAVSGLGSGVTAIAASGSHSLALKSDGSVVAWGDNTYGQLGNNTTTSSTVPVAVSGLSGVAAIAAGGGHSLAMTSTGGVLAWGRNDRGQLGNLSTSNSSVPVVVSGLGGVTAIAAGFSHSLAMRSDGSMVAWGDGSSGQLGDGTSTYQNQPVAVSGLSSGVAAITAGLAHSVALKSDGSVSAWGSNLDGELGNGSSSNSLVPVAVSGLGRGVTAIAAGDLHTLALTSDGSGVAWGFNGAGQLGDGTTTGSSVPVAVKGLGGIPVAIAGGGSHSLAITMSAAVLPVMSNGAYGGYVSAATIQNTGAAPTAVTISYYDQIGALVGTDRINDLPANGSWTVRQDNGSSFPIGGAGSAIVYSEQPIAAFVNEFAPGGGGDATSYTGIPAPSGLGSTLYAPTIVNNAYGGYTTGVGLLNQSSSATDVMISYRTGDGNLVKTQTVSGLAAHAYQAAYSGAAGLPDGFAGTATITSPTGQSLAAVVNETGPGAQFSSYDAMPSGGNLLNVPVALNNAFGGYYTGMGIQNASEAAGYVHVTYYDGLGAKTERTFAISANGSVGVYQGSAIDGPASGAYTAVISSTLPLAAIVNEVAPAGAGSARQSTSYNAFPAGSGSLSLPLVENGSTDSWNTGEGIMNTGATSTTVTVAYHDAVTGASVGQSHTSTLAAKAFLGVYQPDATSGLPAGSRATAVVTTAPGGQLAAITNESSPTTFMSYNGQ